jgi:WD40 repeat protein
VVAVSLARALAYAHQQGVLHRDVKPANLMLDARGTVWLTDFGLAKLECADELTDTGDVVGTLRYLAPERFAGKADARSDVYALALTLFEMATLRPAFDAADRLELVEQIKRGVSVRPRQLEPAVPRDLETIILKGGDAEPQRRYQSAAEMADDMEAFLADRPIKARPIAWWQHLLRWAKGHPAVAALLGVIFLGVLALGIQTWRATTGWAAEKQERQQKEQALLEKEQALEEAKARAYDRNVALAAVRWRDNRLAEAIHLLEECAPELRGWEWHCLRRRCNAHLLALHRPGCLYVGLSQDGRRLVLFFREVTPRTRLIAEIHDVDSNSLQQRIELPGIHFCALRQENETLQIAVSTGKQTLICDGWTGKPLYVIATGLGYFFLIDGKHLGQSDAGVFRLWEITSGTLVRTTALPSSRTTVCGCSPDGKRLFVRTPTSYGVQVIDLQSGKLLRNLPTDFGRIAFPSRTSKTAAMWPTLRVGNTETGGTIRYLVGPNYVPTLVVFSPDGSLIASADDTGLVTVFHWPSGQERVRLRGHGGWLNHLAFDQTGQRLASCDRNGRVLVWDVTSDPEVVVRDWTLESNSNAFSPDGRHFVAGCFGNAHLKHVPLCVRETETARQLGQPLSAKAFGQLLLSHSGERVALYTLDGNGGFSVWDVKTGRQLFHVPERAPRRFYGLAFARTGRIATACVWPHGVDLWDVDTGRLLRTLPAKNPLDGPVCFSPDDVLVAATSAKPPALYVWNADTAEVKRRALAVAPTCVRFDPSGKLLALGLKDGSLALHDVQTLDEVRLMRRHESSVDAVSFHGNGRRLASSSEKTVKIWDVERGREVLELLIPSPSARVRQLVFVDDSLLANVDGAKRQRLRWDGSPVPGR